LNRNEYIANTDPTSTRSYPHIENISFNAQGITVETATAPDRYFEILYADCSNGFKKLNWQPFNNTNNAIGSWRETNENVSTFIFHDDYSTNATDSTPC
jgi:hypothetical protein